MTPYAVTCHYGVHNTTDIWFSHGKPVVKFEVVSSWFSLKNITHPWVILDLRPALLCNGVCYWLDASLKLALLSPIHPYAVRNYPRRALPSTSSALSTSSATSLSFLSLSLAFLILLLQLCLFLELLLLSYITPCRCLWLCFKFFYFTNGLCAPTKSFLSL